MHLFLASSTPRLQRADGSSAVLAMRDAALLAWLALEGPTGRDRLAGLLWPETPALASRNNLRQRLFQLRRAHGDDLIDGRATLALHADVGHDLDDASDVLGDAIGEAAGEFAVWLARARRRRREARALGLARASSDAEQRADYGAALAAARPLLELEPLSEEAHRRVMRLAYAGGDRAAALLAFDRCEQLLKDEVGTAPSAATLALLQTIERSGTNLDADAPRPAPRAVPASVLRPPRLIGREGQWQQLHEAWSGRRFAAVIGDAGLGKTRLVGDFIASHGRVLASGARPGDERVVYASISRLLRGLPRAAFDSLPRSLRGELARLLPELGDAGPIVTPEQRIRFFNAVATALAGDAFDAVFFDDLHFADDASIELLHYAATDTGRPWIVAARPAEVGEPARALLAACLGPPGAVRVELAPLDVAGVAALLESLALDGLGADAAASLHARTGGNPLFLLETLKAGFAIPAVEPGGAAVAASRAAVPVPIAALIERRISRLSAPAVQLARCAAVAAPDFGIELAARVLGVRTLDLADPWAELETAQVLRDGAFAHDLIYESALASVPRPVARQLHAEVAAFLAERGGEPARIAAHWIAAGDDGRALDALLAAADVAWRALRLREQSELLERAADIASRVGRRADAFAALHGWWHTIRIIDRTRIDAAFLARLEQAASSPEQRTEAMLARAIWLRENGDVAASAGVAEAAAAIARSEKLPEHEVKAVLYSAGCASLLGDFERALRLLRSALPWVIAEGGADAQATYFNDLGCCLDHANEVVEAEVFHRRALAVCLSIPSHDRAALSGANLAVNRRNVGAMGDALEVLQQARRHALAIDAAQGVTWPIDLHTFSVLRDLGRYGDALRAGELLLQSMGQNPPMVAAGHTHLACLWIHLGQPARAHRAIEAARGLPTLPFLVARLAQLEGRMKLALGQPALATLQAAAERITAGGRGSLALMIELDLACALPAAAALAKALAVLARAGTLGLAGVALAARIRASRFAAAAGDAGPAVRMAREALATSPAVEPDDIYRGELWLAAAAAFELAGLASEAGEAVSAGVRWVHETAATQVPGEFRAGFMERNPVNRELLARQARLAASSG